MGGAREKSFPWIVATCLCVLAAAPVAATDTWPSTLDFSGGLHDLGPDNTGVQVTEFDVTPLRRPINGCIGYADSSTLVTDYSSLPMLIRMNDTGFFDVRRGRGFLALASVPYRVNDTYHVRMRVDLSEKTYSVWITPPDGTEVRLANRFEFRPDAPPTDDLGKLSLKSGSADNEFQVSHHTVRAENPPPPVDDPVPPPEARIGDDEPPKRDVGGCTAVPGSSLAAAGVMLWMLRLGRRQRRPSPPALSQRERVHAKPHYRLPIIFSGRTH